MNDKPGFVITQIREETLDLVFEFKPPVLKITNFDDSALLRKVRKRCPDILMLGEYPTELKTLDDPVQHARKFCEEMRSTAEELRDVIDVWTGYRSTWDGSPDHVERAAEFERERTRILRSWGLRSAVGGFDTRALDFERWEKFFPALEDADYLHLKEVSGPTLRARKKPLVGRWLRAFAAPRLGSVLRASARPTLPTIAQTPLDWIAQTPLDWIAQRTLLGYPVLYEQIPKNLRKPLIISALHVRAPDGGWSSDMELVEDHVTELQWYGVQAQRDDYVVGVVYAGVQEHQWRAYRERKAARWLDDRPLPKVIEIDRPRLTPTEALTRLVLRKLYRYLQSGDGYALVTLDGASDGKALAPDRGYTLNVSLHGDMDAWFRRRLPDGEWDREPERDVDVTVVGRGLNVRPRRLQAKEGASVGTKIAPIQKGAGPLNVQFYTGDVLLDWVDLSRHTLRVTRRRHFERPRYWRVPLQLEAPSGASYGVALGRRSDLKIELAPADAKGDINLAFISALDAFSGKTRGKGVHLSPEDLAGLARELREAGQFAYNEVFRYRTPIRAEMVRIESDARARDRRLLFDIRATTREALPLIWESLYNPKICAPPTAENHWGLDDVWGFRHVVARRFLGAGYVNVDNYMEGLVERGGMMLLIDDTLKHAVDVEERRLTDLAQEYGLGCRTWPDRRGPSLQELVDLLGDPGFDADFVHFASHAGSTGSRRASELWLKLAKCEKELRVTYGDLGNKVETLCSNPLVFMNGCSTGEEPLLQTRSLVSLFLEKGARGVIATECTVPDVFAAEFAAEFYKRFFYFGRDGIGEALLKTRQHFLEHHNNPLGLAYTLYADGETRIGW